LADKRKGTKLGLLNNCHHPELKPIKIDGKSYMLSNTCAFDSFAQILCVAYCDSSQLKLSIDANDCKLFNLVRHIVTKGVNLSVYGLRAEILRLVFDTEVLPHDVCRIGGTCSISCLVNGI
jgi:hypothetical protein